MVLSFVPNKTSLLLIFKQGQKKTKKNLLFLEKGGKAKETGNMSENG